MASWDKTLAIRTMKDSNKAKYNTGDYLQVIGRPELMIRILAAHEDNTTFLIREINKKTGKVAEGFVSGLILDKMTEEQL